MDMFNRRKHFKLDSAEENFPDTGLKRTSYVAADYMMLVARSELREAVGALDPEVADKLIAFLTDYLRFT